MIHTDCMISCQEQLYHLYRCGFMNSRAQKLTRAKHVAFSLTITVLLPVFLLLISLVLTLTLTLTDPTLGQCCGPLRYHFCQSRAAVSASPEVSHILIYSQ